VDIEGNIFRLTLSVKLTKEGSSNRFYQENIMQTQSQHDLFAAIQSIALSVYEQGPIGLSLCDLLESSQTLVDLPQELLDSLNPDEVEF
tara:strand:- start:15367 stop:15633 length:267 start_codon:yes stop_codon:yes gene_type:complete